MKAHAGPRLRFDESAGRAYYFKRVILDRIKAAVFQEAGALLQRMSRSAPVPEWWSGADDPELQTMRGPKLGSGTSLDQRSAVSTAPCWQSFKLHLCDPRRLSLSGSPVGALRWGESFYLEVHRSRLAAVLFEFELNPLAFVKLGQSRLLDGRDVHEHVLAGGAVHNEAEG
jgi:hypothetical protein